MPTPTYTALANITLGSSASSVTFSSIPATYRDLVLVVNARTTGEGVPRFYINQDGTNTYSYVTMNANGGAQSFSASGIGFNIFGQSGTGFSGTQFMGVAQLMDYSATDKHKTVLIRHSDDSNRLVGAIATRWASTVAINRIQCFMTANSYAAGSTFALYAIVS